VSELLERFFDGKKHYPVLGKVNFVGFTSNMQVKLARIRPETSQIVGSFIEKNNIGPKARVMAEILPSFITYPLLQSKTQIKPSLHSEMGRSAVNEIHSKENMYRELNEL
jgi:hypothetical protein